MQDKHNEIILYQPNNSVRLDVLVDSETVWLNRQQMAVLFDRDVKTIGKHINNALKEELAEVVADFATTPTIADFATVQNKPENVVVANFATVQLEGNREVLRTVEHYNLDVILSVGYRVKSNRGIQFRVWANKVLKDYILKGYAIHDRFLIIDDTVYHIGASLKDLGKKLFAFSRMGLKREDILK